jgi:predicted TIM-barrel enzyme
MAQINITTSATLIASNDLPAPGAQRDMSVLGSFDTGTTTIFLGSTDAVTASGATKGVTWASTEKLDAVLKPGQKLYGIVASGSQTVNVEKWS